MKKVWLIAYEGRVQGEENPFEVVGEDKPLAVVIGSKEVFPDIEEALKEMNEGEEREIILPPERAFGVRRPELIVLIPEREFRRRGIKPYPGLPIEADGRTGRVVAVSAGRVQVDFNHPLAGKTIVYKVKLLREITDLSEAIPHLFRKFFGYEPEEVEAKDGLVKISYVYSREAERAEPLFVAYLMSNFEDIKEVRMEKIYRRREEAKEGSGESTSQ